MANLLVYSALRRGDAIYQLRYVPDLLAEYGPFTLAIHPDLISLVNYNWPILDVISEGVLSESDRGGGIQLDGLDLHYYPRTEQAYLTARPHDKTIASAGKPIVIFNWLSMGYDRCLRTEQVDAILSDPTKTWVNLNPQGADFAHPKLINLGGEIQDYLQTASYIQGADWVISVDTSIAHLSAAMGKQTIVYLPPKTKSRFWVDTALYASPYASAVICRDLAQIPTP